MRDLLLGRPVVDADLVVDGDAIGFADALAKRLGVPARRHVRFGTATVALPGGAGLDVATRRRERYPHRGALPSVEPGTLEEDLARRDFTINAMTVDLASPSPTLVDPLGGRHDLADRLVRMIHPGSPDDDPTRGLRAARYANRLGFRIEPQTARWIRESAAGGALRTISPDRLRRELERLLGEPRPGRAVGLLASLELARAIDKDLPDDAAARRRLDIAAQLAPHLGASVPQTALLAWTAGLSASAARRLAQTLGLSGRAQDRLSGWPARRRRLSDAPARRRPSDLDRRLADAHAEEVAAAAAGLPARDRAALMAAHALRATMKVGVSGADLVAAGIPPGPEVARALAATRAARLDGRIGRREEKGYAIEAAKRLGRARRRHS